MPDGSRQPRRPQREGRRRPQRRYVRRRRRCAFCVDRTKVIDYKNADLLRPFLTQHARIRPRRRTGTCAKHQRQVARAIKRARHIALLPYSHEHARHYRR